MKKMHFRLEFMLPRISEHLGLAKALLRVIAVLCFAAGSATVASASGQQPDGYSPGLSSNFAIADFDGDRRPDLATVEAQKGSASNISQYSIRLQLTAGAAQVFGLTAPAGGLQIVARDVNGDNALDVLVSTAWLHKQIAVLLNDGHGNFTLADPAAFPSARWENVGNWNSGRPPLCESSVLLRIEHRAGELERESKFDKPIAELGRSRGADFRGVKKPFLFAPLGRAPPAFVLPS
jgi:hypothetical protein